MLLWPLKYIYKSMCAEMFIGADGHYHVKKENANKQVETD